MRRSVVVALGGNAFTKEGQRGTYTEQSTNALAMAHGTYTLIQSGWNVAIVHGNGPQVGSLAIQQEEGADFVPAQPLFQLGAMTEAYLGSMISLALRRASQGRVEAVAVVTHTVVAFDDPAFDRPTKPIGPFFPAAEVEGLTSERGWTMVEDSGRGWRRVVPSPRPISIVESAAIRTLVNSGAVVIAAGGGGIPVVATEEGYVGVDAVVDKDYAAEQVASSIGADTLVLVTGVDKVAINFGKPDMRMLDVMTTTEAEAWLAAGQFPEGSMGPKVRAAIDFVRNGGRRAVITSPEMVAEALASTGAGPDPIGTTIVLSESLAGSA